jgi:hypothetical protein
VRLKEKVSVIDLMTDRKSEIEEVSVRHKRYDGQKNEIERRNVCDDCLKEIVRENFWRAFF